MKSLLETLTALSAGTSLRSDRTPEVSAATETKPRKTTAKPADASAGCGQGTCSTWI